MTPSAKAPPPLRAAGVVPILPTLSGWASACGFARAPGDEKRLTDDDEEPMIPRQEMKDFRPKRPSSLCGQSRGAARAYRDWTLGIVAPMALTEGKQEASA